MVKSYVIDTNVLLQDPNAILGFEENDVIIPSTVLGELDNKKRADGDLGYNARECIRLIEGLRTDGNLVKGIDLPNGGRLFIEPDGIDQENLPNGFDISKADNKIISTCVYLKKKHPKRSIILVSNDLAMRISASVVLKPENVESYRNTHVQKQNYAGVIDLDVASELIDSLYKEPSIDSRALDDYIVDGQPELTENAFITLHCGSQSVLTVNRLGRLEKVSGKRLFGGVKALNTMQSYAIWALTAPASEVPLVIMEGPAGTAKTYLSLAAGLTCTYTDQNPEKCEYYKMLISRPNSIAGDPGFGYLPGNLEEKMEPLLLPYYDNLTALFRGQGRSDEIGYSEIQTSIDDLFESGVVELCALSFIRGRSLQKCYLICDEAQNATRTLIRDVITRAGEGTKIVICGDPDQCDNPVLDSRSNGLVYAAECFRNSPLAAIVRFSEEHSVRSRLAKEAIRRMTV
ncbi:MAG: PhoH family protein [Anaerovoracaceae bacterium]|jgi:PhoH-like ATPase